MKEQLRILTHNRKVYSYYLKNLTLEQLNKVPEGFNNNIIWNIGHVLVVQQGLMYKLSGVPICVPKEWEDAYKKGTKPERDVTQEEVDAIRGALFSTLEQLEKDLEADVFKNFHPYTTSTKMELTSIKEAFTFVLFHDGLHLGSVLALNKFV